MSIDKHVTAAVKYSYTDSSWRCVVNDPASVDSLTPHLPWFSPKYDDWSWPGAVSLARNGMGSYLPMEAVSGDAEWIWTDMVDSGEGEDEQSVYCRGWLSEFPDTLWIGSADASTKVSVYANGEKLGETTEVHKRAAQFTLPGQDNHVIAIYSKVTKKEAPRGLIASLQVPKPPGGVTGNMWRCKSSLSASEVGTWMLESFDDTDWPQAEVIAHHTDEPYTVVVDVSPFAFWVWSKYGEDEDEAPAEVFCRCSVMASNGVKSRQQLSAESSGKEDEYSPLPITAKGSEVVELSTDDVDNMTTLEFYKEYIAANRPVRIKGGINHWPAMRLWTDAYLRKKIGNEAATVTLSQDKNDVFYFYSEKKVMKDMNVQQFIDKYQQPGDDNRMYLAQHPLKRVGRSAALNMRLAADLDRPRVTQLLEIDAVNLWMGAGGQVTPAHFDNYENFMCMVDGHKKFRLYEPAMSNFIYPVMHNLRTGITSRISNFSKIDFAAFPKAAHLKPVFVELNAGDLFFLPSYWWHEVTSVGRNVAVNWWFRSHSQILDNIYGGWLSSLPQTKWGLLAQQKYDEMKEKTGMKDEYDEDADEDSDDGSRRRRGRKKSQRDEL
ncbi:uncharacterized protein LOC135808252 isoform X2 [Sycon ciliatum]